MYRADRLERRITPRRSLRRASCLGRRVEPVTGADSVAASSLSRGQLEDKLAATTPHILSLEAARSALEIKLSGVRRENADLQEENAELLAIQAQDGGRSTTHLRASARGAVL